MNQQLQLILDLVDRFSRPLRNAGAALGNFANKAKANFQQIGTGAAAIWGIAESMKGVLNPAYEMNNELNKIKALDVSEAALKRLSSTALDFSMKYGVSAKEFVSSANEMQQAIDSLKGNELSDFTMISNLLAKGAGADAKTITAYMGTMYGIFKDEAESMGLSNWVKMVAGQTAEAAKIFKSDGQQMSDAMTSIGANAKAAGIGMSEQFAVLGQLQATMSGSEAGTKYKAFLQGVGKAQTTLGLKFVDSAGKMKGITEIMSLIQNKYGDISKVADSDLIKKAFGSDEAVSFIKLLAVDTQSLAGNIKELEKIRGIEKLQKMAETMVDPWQRLVAIWYAIRVVIGRTLFPVLDPVLNKMTAMGTKFAEWMEMFPNIAKAIGYVTLGIIGLGAVAAVVTIIAGIFSLLTSPIMLIIAALAILAWAIYDQYKYWSWALGMIGADLKVLWGRMVEVWGSITEYIAGVWKSIQLGWQETIAFFAGLSPAQAFTDFANTIGGVFDGLWDYLKSTFANTYNWIVEKLNMIPGVELDLKPVVGASVNTPPPGVANQQQILTGGNAQSSGRDGLLGQMAVTNNNNKSPQKSVTIGEMNINTQNAPTPAHLAEWRELYGD